MSSRSGNLSTYSADGIGNNIAQVEWGSTQEKLLRLAKAEYGDGISTPNGTDRPSARAISNAIADQGDIISDRAPTQRSILSTEPYNCCNAAAAPSTVSAPLATSSGIDLVVEEIGIVRRRRV